MKKLFFLILLMVGTTALAVAAVVQNDVQRAEMLIQEGNYEEAEQLLGSWLEDADSTDAHYEEAQRLFDRTGRTMRYLKRRAEATITDSLVVAVPDSDEENTILTAALNDAAIGKVKQEQGLYSFTNPRGDRRYVSVRTSDGRTLLCKQERLLDSWGELDTLPDIVNFCQAQNYPFLMEDGLTLYFAAEDENGLGGWDIYVTRFKPSEDNYTTPELVSLPFNSTGNDFLYLYNETGHKGCFFSDRSGQLMRYSFRPIDAEEQEEQVLPLLPDAPEYDFTLAINDSVVYHSLADFHTDEAREQAKEYLDLLSQIEEEATDLAAKREAYLQAETADEKKTLSPVILTEEKDLRRLRKEATELLQTIRQAER